jgi:hypothetical protein
MTSRDLVSNIKPVQHVVNAVITATNTPANGVSHKGFESVGILIILGAIANIANSPKPSWSLKIQESDDNVNWTDVTNANRILVSSSKLPVTTPNSSTGVFLVVDAAAEDETCYLVGLITDKEYSRVVNTAANTPGSMPYSVVYLLGNPSIAPTSH